MTYNNYQTRKLLHPLAIEGGIANDLRSSRESLVETISSPTASSSTHSERELHVNVQYLEGQEARSPIGRYLHITPYEHGGLND